LSNASTLVHGWASERAHELRSQANKVDAAYTGGAMAEACRVYAAGLRSAAGEIEAAARVIIALQSSSKAGP
jgi:hypothetical protein